MSEAFLLQMAGVPASGKSAVARLIGRATGAVMIDKDVLKSAALVWAAIEPRARVCHAEQSEASCQNR